MTIVITIELSNYIITGTLKIKLLISLTKVWQLAIVYVARTCYLIYNANSLKLSFSYNNNSLAKFSETFFWQWLNPLLIHKNRFVTHSNVCICMCTENAIMCHHLCPTSCHSCLQHYVVILLVFMVCVYIYTSYNVMNVTNSVVWK